MTEWPLPLSKTRPAFKVQCRDAQAPAAAPAIVGPFFLRIHGVVTSSDPPQSRPNQAETVRARAKAPCGRRPLLNSLIAGPASQSNSCTNFVYICFLLFKT